MKFRVESETFADTAALVAKAASSDVRYSNHLAAIKLMVDGDKLGMVATDLDVSLSTSLAVSETEAGAVLVPAQRLADGAKAMPAGALEVEQEAQDHLTIRCGSAVLTVPLLLLADFPAIADTTEGSQMDGPSLHHALAQVVPAMGRDNTRPTLFGVTVASREDGIALYGSDSRAMHRSQLPGSWDGPPVVVPFRVVSLLRQMPEAPIVTVERLEGGIAFSVGEVRMTGRLIEDGPPDYERLMANYSQSKRAEMDTAGLLDAVERVSLVVEKDAPLRFDCSEDGLVITGRSPDGAGMVDRVEMDWSGEPFSTGFLPPYVKGAAKVVGSERIALYFGTNPLHPVRVEAVPEDRFVALVMPHRGYENVR